MVVVVALAMMLFTVTASILSALLAAPSSFAGQGDHVVLSADAATIFSSRVDEALVQSLLSQDAVTAAWAEVVALSAWNGKAFIVRGMSLAGASTSFPFSSLEIQASSSLENGRSALIGSRLLDRLEIDVPYTLPLTGSYSSRVEFVEAVGSFDSGTYLDDEMLVHLDVARHLCGMPEGTASAIGVATDDPEWLADVLAPEGARFALFDVGSSKTAVVIGEEVTVSAEVANWGSEGGDATLQIGEGSAILDEMTETVAASSTATVTSTLTFSSLGTHTIDVRLMGTMAMRSSLNISVVEPFLTISAPSRAIVGAVVEASVLTHAGEPVAGAAVGYSVGEDSGTLLTDDAGNVGIPATHAGEMTITASSPGLDGDTATVEVVDLSSYPDDFLPVVRSFSISSAVVSEQDDVIVSVVVENNGAVAGWYELSIYVDSSEHSTLNLSLGPAGMRSVPIVLNGLRVGSHTIRAGTYSHEVIVEPWYADEPDLVQLVIRYGGTGTLSSSSAIPIYQAAKVSEGNIAVALFSIGAISGLLSMLAISAVFAKEVHEGRDTLGILRTLGASSSNIRRMVLFQAFAGALSGSAIGIAAGIAAAISLVSSGAFLIFGHEIAIQIDASLLAPIAFGAVTISALSALASAEAAVRETPMASIRKLEPDVVTSEDSAGK
ncbi:MAG: FtsX-like permease family protein [Methanobacteriota archaeon]|nr:MAG: FtsX-like permease family protein [Euryarchaeota archaeon]